MDCRDNCGACCIAPSLTNAYYGMPYGKKAGQVCVHLNLDNYRCAIWGSENYPDTCKQFAPDSAFCGTSREDALAILDVIEVMTKP